MSTEEIMTLHRRIDEVNITLSKNTTNTDWLMRFFWIIATASVGGLIGNLFVVIKLIK